MIGISSNRYSKLVVLVVVSVSLSSSAIAASFFTPSTSTRTPVRRSSSASTKSIHRMAASSRSSSSSTSSCHSILQMSGGATEDTNNNENEETPPSPPSSPAPPAVVETETAAITTTEEAVVVVAPPTPDTTAPPPVVGETTTPAPPPSAAAVALLLNQQQQLGPKAPPPGWLRRTLPRFPWHKVPDYVTYARCVAIPVLMAMFYAPQYDAVATSSLFAVASFTDWLDGYLARKWDISTKFGAFLDPVADKLMVSTALILLSGKYGTKIVIPTIIILARELAVSALREWMASNFNNRDAVQVGMQGKVKTAATMVSLTLLLLVPSVPAPSITSTGAGTLHAVSKFFLTGNPLFDVGVFTLYLCALITITSGSVYFKAAAPYLFN